MRRTNPATQQRLSRRQEQILAFIRQSLAERGFPPSIRECCLAVGLSSSSTVHSHLCQLERKGFIRRDRDKPRGIQVVEQAPTHWRTRLSELGLQQDAGHEDVVGKLLEGLEVYNSREMDAVCSGVWVVRCLANPESVAGGIMLEAILEQRRGR